MCIRDRPPAGRGWPAARPRASRAAAAPSLSRARRRSVAQVAAAGATLVRPPKSTSTNGRAS
eukprot:3727562-Alexandrium_andersonii.AAC.1